MIDPFFVWLAVSFLSLTLLCWCYAFFSTKGRYSGWNGVQTLALFVGGVCVIGAALALIVGSLLWAIH